MNQVLQGDEAGLVAYYRLNEAGGDIVRDATAFAHDGVLGVFGTVTAVTGLFDTAVDDDGVPLASGDDPHYQITNHPGLGNLADAIFKLGGPGQQPTFTGIGNGVSGDYTFQTTFELPANVDVSSVQITGRWFTLDAGVDIRINGLSVGAELAGSSRSGADFLINGGFLPGKNHLEFVVHDDPGIPGSAARIKLVCGSSEWSEHSILATRRAVTPGLVTFRTRSNSRWCSLTMASITSISRCTTATAELTAGEPSSP